MRPLPGSVQRLWRLAAVTIGGLVAVVGGGFAAVLVRFADVPWPVVLGPVVLGAVVGGVGWALATLRFRAWGFELTDEWIRARWGVIIRRSATIPRNRVQTMTSENGPIDRLLGLTSVVVHTAGAGAPNLEIPHLADDDVDWLRDELARGRVEQSATGAPQTVTAPATATTAPSGASGHPDPPALPTAPPGSSPIEPGATDIPADHAVPTTDDPLDR